MDCLAKYGPLHFAALYLNFAFTFRRYCCGIRGLAAILRAPTISLCVLRSPSGRLLTDFAYERFLVWREPLLWLEKGP